MNATASELSPAVADSPVVEAQVASAQSPSTDSESLAADSSSYRLLGLLLGSTATSWYLSALFHVIAYVGAAVAFVMLGHHFIDVEREVTPIRASLDDFDREAERPKFEAVAQITLGATNGDSDVQKLANTLKAYENGIIDTVASDELPSFMKSNDEDVDDGSSGFLFRVPESGLAVTKGSFTAWTEPERPRPGQRYLIIIEVRLPDNVKAYRITDLRGKVTGTDRYTQRIPYDSKTPHSSFYTDDNNQMQRIGGSEAIKVRGNKVQLAIQVPGADRLVRDTIEISSRRLREKQKLELTFGGR